MKKILLYLLITTGILSGGCSNADNKLTDKEIGEGWQLLFDGKSLNGWRDYHGETVTGPWIAEKGTLTSLGQGSDSTGYIITDRQYENFILTFDWKISEGGIGYFMHTGGHGALPSDFDVFLNF